MPTHARIELKDFPLNTCIGSYAPGEHAPDRHLLALTLWIPAELVLIPEDGMAHVFDYDPLVREIEALAQDGPYETQERLMTRIVQACAQHPAIEALDVALHKAPIRPAGGSLGLRLSVDAPQLAQMRASAAAPYGA